MITKRPKNILVADDSLFFRTKLKDILTEAGHTVRLAGSGEEAVREIKGANRVDLLILDMQMPGSDGFDVLEWINRNGHRGDFKILVITGVLDPANVMDTLRSFGVDGIMTKTATPEQIIFRSNRILFPGAENSAYNPRRRVPVSIPVDYSLGSLTKSGFFLNISEGGAFLHTEEELLPGAMLRLRFCLVGDGKYPVLELKGIVKWTTEDVAGKALFGGSGIMFTSVSGEELETLKNYIDFEIKRLGLDGGEAA